MKIRFQADADLNQIIVLATIRNEPAIDFQTSFAGGLVGLKDIASAVENLILLWSATDDSEWINRICFLPL